MARDAYTTLHRKLDVSYNDGPSCVSSYLLIFSFNRHDIIFKFSRTKFHSIAASNALTTIGLERRLSTAPVTHYTTTFILYETPETSLNYTILCTVRDVHNDTKLQVYSYCS